VRALRTRLSHWQRAWGRCFSLRPVARYVVTLTQPRRQQPNRARPTEEFRMMLDVLAENMSLYLWEKQWFRS